MGFYESFSSRPKIIPYTWEVGSPYDCEEGMWSGHYSFEEAMHEWIQIGFVVKGFNSFWQPPVKFVVLPAEAWHYIRQATKRLPEPTEELSYIVFNGIKI